MDATARTTFEEHESVDFAYEIPNVSRFRVNAFQHLNGMGAVFRAIPSQAMTLEQLNMPRVISLAAHFRRPHSKSGSKTGRVTSREPR